MLLLQLATLSMSSPPDLTVQAQVRPRLEVRSTRTDGTSVAITQRARLSTEVESTDGRAVVVLQDVRAWGSETHTLLDFSADGLDLQQGYLELHRGPIKLTVGRQQVAWHGQRLLGAVGWAQSGRSFDAARLRASHGDWEGEVLATLLRTPGGTDDTPGTGWLTGARGGTAGIQALWYSELDPQLERMRHTSGLWAAHTSKGGLRLRGEVYAQFGEDEGRAVRAGLASVKASYNTDSKGTPTIWTSVDLVSGAGPAGWTPFNVQFGTNHKYYGLSDVVLFSISGGKDGDAVLDLAAGAKVTPAEKWTLEAQVHHFAATNRRGSLIGQELDLSARHLVTDWITMSFGGAIFSGPTTGHGWAYLQLDARK